LLLQPVSDTIVGLIRGIDPTLVVARLALRMRNVERRKLDSRRGRTIIVYVFSS
jgi:hypothetical protein